MLEGAAREPKHPSTSNIKRKIAGMDHVSSTHLSSQGSLVSKSIKSPPPNQLALEVSMNPPEHEQASLFLKRLPIDIRYQIYGYLLATDAALNLDIKPHFRRGEMSLEFLRTCRQLYFEARHLPLSLNRQVSILLPCSNLTNPDYEKRPFERLRQWQKDNIRHVHLFGLVCELCFQRGVYLKVLLSRMAISESLKSVRISWYLDTRVRGKCSRNQYWSVRPREDLRSLPGLETLIIDFSMVQALPGHLAYYIPKVKTWRFRTGPNRFLEFDGLVPNDNNQISGLSGVNDLSISCWPGLGTETYRWSLRGN